MTGPGWDAITAACAKAHADVEPIHFTVEKKASDGGKDPLDAISAWSIDFPAHWHFITYGLSDLYAKKSNDPRRSGWGLELTFRVARGHSAEPPNWALSLLQNLARWMIRSGAPFEDGQLLPCHGPIALGEETRVVAVTFRADPELGEIDTPHGRVRFVQVVGLTEDEHAAAIEWDPAKLLAEIARTDPLLSVDLERDSVLADPAMAARVREGVARDGSSTEGLFFPQLDYKKAKGVVRVAVGAVTAAHLARVLPARIPFGRDLGLLSPRARVLLAPADETDVILDDDELVIALTNDAARALAEALRPRRGTYVVPEIPGLEVHVMPTEVKGPDGLVKQVVG